MTQIGGSAVFVTGANRGIGAELVRQLLKRGAARVYASARDPRRIDFDDERVAPVSLDVTDQASVQTAAAAVGQLDIVINNAGIASSTSVIGADTSRLRLELETNLFGPLAVTRALTDHLPRGTGAVVTIASVASWIGLGGTYGVSKAALWSAIESMRLELAPRGTQVTAVHMAQVDTDLTVGSTAPKSDPAIIVAQILDGIENGETEVLADDVTRSVRAHLGDPVGEQMQRFASHAR